MSLITKSQSCRYSLLAIISAFIMTIMMSCSESNNNEEPEDTRATETILMFFPYSEGLSEAFASNVNDMKTAIETNKGMGKTRVIVVMAKTSVTAKMFEIVYADGTCQEKDIELTMDLTFSSDNQSDVTSSLQSLFYKVKEVAPAHSYAMIIGSHGKSWMPAGGFTLADCYKPKAMNKAIGSAGKDYQIDNLSLVTALQNVGLHLNYLLLDACYMANIEAAYDFSNICDYYISSPTEIMGVGIPYNTAGQALLRHDYQTLVDEYRKFYVSYSMPYGTLSVTDCRYIDEMADVMRQISQNMTSDGLETVQQLDAFSQTVFYDMADYVDKCCKNETLKSQFKTSLSKLVPYKCSTPSFYSATPSGGVTKDIKAYCGLSTSQPTTNSVAQKYIAQTSWWIATH
ncbi:MAG: clostripain-related cysteine peptidase [Prevotella sp.]